MLNHLRCLRVVNRRASLWLALLALVACNAGDNTGSIRVGLSTAPVTFDPRFATDATSYRVNRLIYESLVDFDESHRPVPALATWQAVSPTVYRFTLQKESRFHDGTTLDAADVVATYESVLDPSVASPHRGSLVNIATLRALSRDTIEFVLNMPDPLFPGLLVIGILPRTSLASGVNQTDIPIGSGPFAVVEPPRESRLRLRRRSDEQIVEFITVKDATVRALKLIRGEIDVIQGSISPELVDWLAARPRINAVQRAGTTFTYLGFNLADPVLSEPRLRRAIAHAIDRQALSTHLFGGRARLAQAIFTPDHWAGDPSLEPLDYNPDSARALLAELGYGRDKRLELSYKTSSDYFRLRVATVIQAQLSEIGIDLKISSYDWGTFYADIKAGRFQLYSLSWVGIKQPDIFRYVFHSESVPPQGANRGRYVAPRVDALIERAESTNALDERAALYRQIQREVLHDLPYVPLWYEDNTVVYRDAVVGYDTGIDGYYDGLIHARRVTP